MASNVIDSLLIELGFSNAGALEGIQQTQSELDKTAKAAKQTGASMEQSGSQGAMFFRQIRNEALLMLSLFTGGYGIKTFVSNTIEELSKLGYTAENMDMAPERLTEWGQAAEKAGGSAQSMTAMLAKANQDIAATHAGSARLYSQLSQGEGVLNFFSQGGLNPADMKNGEELLLNYADVLHKVYEEQGGAAAITLAQTMGVDAESFNFLKQGREAVLLQIAAMEKYAIKNKENTENAQQLKGKLSDLGSEFNSLGTRIALQFFPVVDWLAEKLKKFGDYMINNKEAIAKTFNTWAENIKNFAIKIDGVAKSMGGWQTIIEALITIKIGSWIANLMLMSMALNKVALAFGAVTAAYMAGTWIHDTFATTIDPIVEKGLDKVDELAGKTILRTPAVNEVQQQNLIELRKAGKKYNFNADEVIEKYAEVGKKYGVDPNLLIAQAKQESGFNPNAKSPAGARGFAQFMPDTAKRFGLTNPNDPIASIEAQAKYMKFLQDKFHGNVELMLGGYNAGEGSIKKKDVLRDGVWTKEQVLPPYKETQDYVKRIMESYAPGGYVANMQKAIPNTINEKRGNVATTNNTTTSDTKVNIVVNAKSNDPKGIANETKKAFSNAGSLTFQANTGLTA